MSFYFSNTSRVVEAIDIFSTYFPKEVLWPFPPALKPKGPEEAVPTPFELENPPFCALAKATPVADTPPGPACPVPNPAPLPDGRGKRPLTILQKKCHRIYSFFME